MALRLAEKRAIVAEVAAVAADAHSAIAVEYLGLTANELTELRKTARDAAVYLRVVKNTLARRALEGTGFACMQESLVGPLMLAFSMEEPGSAARVVKEFAQDHKQLDTKIVAIGGQLYGPSELERLSNLPTREQSISLLMAAMKAPIEKFVKTLAEPQAKLVRTIAAVRVQKEEALS